MAAGCRPVLITYVNSSQTQELGETPIPGPPRVSDSVGLGWVRESAFLADSEAAEASDAWGVPAHSPPPTSTAAGGAFTDEETEAQRSHTMPMVAEPVKRWCLRSSLVTVGHWLQPQPHRNQNNSRSLVAPPSPLCPSPVLCSLCPAT